MAGLVFVHSKVVPGVAPSSSKSSESPIQRTVSGNGRAAAFGRTVMLKLREAKGQGWGVTVTTELSGLLPPCAVKVMAPEPAASRPMAGFELVHSYSEALPLKGIFTASPSQTVISGGGSISEPCTVIVNVTGSPSQAALAGVTVIWAVSVWGALTDVKAIFPVPEAGRPMAGLSFVQLNASALPVNAAATGLPPHTVISGGVVTVGRG